MARSVWCGIGRLGYRYLRLLDGGLGYGYPQTKLYSRQGSSKEAGKLPAARPQLIGEDVVKVSPVGKRLPMSI